MKTAATDSNFIADIKKDIISRLNDYKGGSYYGCDLAYTLFEGENADGSVFCNTYKTEEFIKENFSLFGALVQYCKDSLDMTLNPFSEPEKAHVILLLESANTLMGRLPLIERKWNERIELTDKVIKRLTKEVNELEIEEEDLF